MISVITPTARPESLNITAKCLRRQFIRDFEWIVTVPGGMENKVSVNPDVLLIDPSKKGDDFWSLCKGWNQAYAKAKGDLIVNIQDQIWFDETLLERFLNRFRDNPKALVTAVGDHYSELDEYGKPIKKVWDDPRKRIDHGEFYQVSPSDMEMSVCSIPKQAILDCGGIDEEYDKGPGIQEKEMCFRLKVLGYGMWIDQTIEYLGIKHDRMTDDWDDKYWGVTAPMFKKHMFDLSKGERPLNVGNIEKYL